MKEERDWKFYDLIEHASVLDSGFNFQRRFNVVFRLMWRRDVAKCEINVKATSCTSTLKFTTLNNIESTSSISTLIWTILDNVEATFTFSMSIFTTLVNVKTTLWIWPFEQKNEASSQKQNSIFELQRIRWTQNLLQFVPHFKRNMQKNICRAATILKTSNILT